jgi:hypothetical protein
VSSRESGPFELATLLVGTVCVAGALWSAAGIPGAVSGLIVGIVTVTSSRFYGVVLAHLAVLVPTSAPEIQLLVLLELGSFVYLLSEFAPADRRRDGGLALALALVLASGLLVVARDMGTVWAAVVLVGLAGSAGYALHRYGEARLGLLTEDAA